VIARIALFLFWAVACMFLLAVLLVGTQIGDCFDVQRCVAFKGRAALVIFIVVPAMWLAGALFLVNRWNR
jgi:hypothetical protein